MARRPTARHLPSSPAGAKVDGAYNGPIPQSYLPSFLFAIYRNEESP